MHEESILKLFKRYQISYWDLILKISEFGLAKLDEEDNTHISTKIAGTK